MTERVKDIYKYWLNQNLEDTELTKELETISWMPRHRRTILQRFGIWDRRLKGNNGSWNQSYECLYSCQSHPRILQLFEKKYILGKFMSP